MNTGAAGTERRRRAAFLSASAIGDTMGEKGRARPTRPSSNPSSNSASSNIYRRVAFTRMRCSNDPT
jgi:hypothetical protein